MKSYIVRRVGGRQNILKMMEDFTIMDFCDVYDFSPNSVSVIERRLNRRFLRTCKICEKKFKYAEIKRNTCGGCKKETNYSKYQKNESVKPLSAYGDADYRCAKKKFRFASAIWGASKGKLRLRGQNWLA